MSRWLAGLASLVAAGALLVLGFDTLLIRGQQRRITALEAEVTALRTEPVLPSMRPDPSRGGVPDAARDERRRAFDQALAERIESVMAEQEHKREEGRVERMQLLVAEQIDEWAHAHQLDPRTLEQTQAVVANRAELSRVVRQDVRDGAVTMAEARDELDDAHEAMNLELRKLLGDSRFQSLEEDVLSRLRPQGPPPP